MKRFVSRGCGAHRSPFLASLASLAFLAVFSGCGGGLKTMIRLRPLQEAGGVIQSSQKALSKEKEGIRVTVTFYDRARLEGLADNVAHNPFISEYKTLNTVFFVEVENKREGKITVEPQKCVVLDGLGHQLNGWSVGDFERLFPTTSASGLTYSSVFNEYTPTMVYTPDYYKRKAAKDLLLKGGELYPGVKQGGLVAFDSLTPEAVKVTLIVPVAAEGPEGGAAQKMEFSFPFAQEISPELK